MTIYPMPEDLYLLYNSLPSRHSARPLIERIGKLEAENAASIEAEKHLRAEAQRLEREAAKFKDQLARKDEDNASLREQLQVMREPVSGEEK